MIMMYLRAILIALALLTGLFNLAIAETVSREQIKGLDEQVQDIKKDVLAISSELKLLEEKLLFPSNTQVSIFISVSKNSQYTPDAVKIKIDDKAVAHHIYSFREVGALHKGGVQRLYTGNIRNGEHKLDVSIIGRQANSELQKQNASFNFKKNVGAKLVELSLGAGDSLIEIKER